MAAEIQYADAERALTFLERDFLQKGSCTTYGGLCKAIGYVPAEYARHVGQVCSLIDAACYWSKLPFLSLEKIRLEDGNHNPDSFSGEWGEIKATLIDNATKHEWTVNDIARIRRALLNMNDESALLQWKRIDGFGAPARARAVSYV